MAEQLSNEQLDDLRKSTDSLNKSFDNIFKKTGDINKNLKEQYGKLSSILSTVKDIEDAEDAVVEAEKIKNKLLNSGYNISKKQAKVLTDAITQFAKSIKDMSDGSDEFDSNVTSLESRVKGMLGALDSMVSEIPVVGKALSSVLTNEKLNQFISGSVGSIRDAFGTTFNELRKNKSTFAQSVTGGLQASITGFKKLLASINPLKVGLLGLSAIIAGIAISAFKADEAAGEFRQTTGLLTTQTKGLRDTMRSVVMNTSQLGVSLQDAYTLAGAFSNEFENIEQVSKFTANSILSLNKNFGLATDTAVKANKVFQVLGDLTQDQAQYLLNSTVLLAEQAKVAPNKVIQDIADNSEVAYTFFDGSVDALGAAAVAAARMGSSIGKASELASKLLDFESSISSELNASAMLGTRLNFSRARYLAINGDIVGSQKEILNQVKQIGDLDSLNYYQKQALADATGMQFGEMKRMFDIQERFGELDATRLEAYNKLISLGKDASAISDEDLRKQEESIKAQNKFRSDFAAFKDQLAGVGSALLASILPVGTLLLNILNATLVPALTKINQLFSDGNNFLGSMALTIGAIGTGVSYILTMKLKQKAIDSSLLALSYAQQKVDVARSLIASGIAAVRKSSLALAVKEKLINLKDAGLGLLKWVFTAASSVAKIPFVGPLLAAAAAAGAYAIGKSYFSKAGDVYSPARGATQVSTKEGGLFELSPNDDLIAAPNLAGKLGGGNVGALINEVKMLRKDLNSGKIGVYMDGKKVTSRISDVVSGYGGNSYSIV